MKLTGRINISRTSGGDESTPIRIEIVDDASHCRVVEVRMTCEGFAEAITGRGHVPCELEFYPEAPIGKIHEHKTEVVMIPKTSDYSPRSRTKSAKLAMKPLEVDGWTGNVDDFMNHHRHNGGRSTKTHDAYNVNFVRYVDATVKV